MKQPIRLLLFLLGLISLGLGILGVFLPVLPTTPFILLAAYLFGKSSARFHRYLIQHKVFGPVITDFQVNRVLSRKTKIISLTMMWIVLLSSVILFMPFWWAKTIVLLIGAGTTIYLVRFPEKKNDEFRSSNNESQI